MLLDGNSIGAVGGNYTAKISTSALVTLAAGNVIDLAISTTDAPAGTNTIGANGNAILTVKRLN